MLYFDCPSQSRPLPNPVKASELFDMTPNSRLFLLLSLLSALGAFSPLGAQTPTPTATPFNSCSNSLSVSKNIFYPLNGETVDLNVNLCENGNYQLDIFNSAGELVRVLRSNGNQAALQEQVLWDGKNTQGETAASGIYVIRYTNPTDAIEAKVILIH